MTRSFAHYSVWWEPSGISAQLPWTGIRLWGKNGPFYRAYVLRDNKGSIPFANQSIMYGGQHPTLKTLKFTSVHCIYDPLEGNVHMMNFTVSPRIFQFNNV